MVIHKNFIVVHLGVQESRNRKKSHDESIPWKTGQCKKQINYILKDLKSYENSRNCYAKDF